MRVKLTLIAVCCIGGLVLASLPAPVEARTFAHRRLIRPHAATAGVKRLTRQSHRHHGYNRGGDRPVMMGTGYQGCAKLPQSFRGWGSQHQAITIDARTGRLMSIDYNTFRQVMRR